MIEVVYWNGLQMLKEPDPVRGLQVGNGRVEVLAAPVVEADLRFPLCQNLLHIAQLLLGARNQRGIRKHVDHGPVFLLRIQRVGVVAVGLLHLLVVDVAHLHLCFGRFRRVGEEGDEVVVLRLGLGQGRGTTVSDQATPQDLGFQPKTF